MEEKDESGRPGEGMEDGSVEEEDESGMPGEGMEDGSGRVVVVSAKVVYPGSICSLSVWSGDNSTCQFTSFVISPFAGMKSA